MIELGEAAGATGGEGTAKDRTLRAYSKKHRVYVFREFLLKTYGNYLQGASENKNDDGGHAIILDVAGGKGDLSWILHNVDDFQSIVVDPRRTVDHIVRSVEYLRWRPEECLKRAVRDQHTYQPIAALMPQLQAKDYRTESPAHLRIFLDQELVDTVRAVLELRRGEEAGDDCSSLKVWTNYWEMALRRSDGFVTPTGKNDFSIEQSQCTKPLSNSVTDAKSALELILSARLVVGFHPDQATDFCFALAELLQIPVCVVPCCVFPSEFPHRQLHGEREDGEENKQVEKYADLIQYLRQEHPHALTATLPFAGTTTARNIVLYTLPLSS